MPRLKTVKSSKSANDTPTGRWRFESVAGFVVEVLVKTDDEQILKDLKADSRGRITLGGEFAGETVAVAVVSTDADGDKMDE